jgi:hypothetical protein
MKTVLAPGAPWPNYEAKAETPKPKPRTIPPKKVRSRIDATDARYAAWADRNLGEKQ